MISYKIILGFLIGLVIGVFMAYSPSPLQEVHEAYNHIQMYEDGSYSGETREGQFERGCVLKGQCRESIKR